MPVTIKRGMMKYKNPITGEYVGVDVAAERTTAEQIALLEQKGQEVLGNLPDDYEELASDVEQLKTTVTSNTGRITDIEGQKINKPSTNPNGTSGQILRSNGDGSTTWSEAATAEEVVSATTAWLNEHVSGGSTIAVDDSLSVTGAAADAKKTGDEISDLKSALQADETFLGLNINKTSLWSAGTISSSTGATASASNNDKIRTGYIDRKIAFVEPESGYYVCIYAYDSNNNDSYVGCWDGTMYKTSIQRKYVRMNINKIPLSYKVRLVFSKSDNTSISTDDSSHLIVSVFTDETLTTSGKPADAKITGDIINQNSEKNEYDFRSLMLDNYDTSLWVSGTINSSTGITAPANNKIRTGYISISDSKIVRVTPESGYYLHVFVYSSNTQESYLGNWTGSGYVSNLVKYTDVANINGIPKNYYIRIVGSKSNNSDMTSSDYSSFIFSKFKADDLEEKYDDLMGYYVDEGDPVD